MPGMQILVLGETWNCQMAGFLGSEKQRADESRTTLPGRLRLRAPDGDPSEDCFPPFSQRTRESGVGTPAENFHKRIAAFRRKPKRERENHHRCKLVLPPIKPPLSFPKPDRVTKERFAVANRPQVGRRWPARADQITEQVQVENDEAHQRHAALVSREKREKNRDRDCCGEAVQQQVMITLIFIE